jgi:hypothetical protein
MTMNAIRVSARKVARSMCAAMAVAAAWLVPSETFAAGGWAWAQDATTSNYDADPSYSFNGSGGAIHINRNSQGSYTVTFDGLTISAGNAQVTSYGPGTNYCNVGSWGWDTVNVLCHAQGGAPADSRFVVSFVEEPANEVSRGAGYVWKDDTDGINNGYSWNSTGGANTLVKLGTGAYEVTFANLGFRAISGGRYEGPSAKPIVTAYGGGGGYCAARETPYSQGNILRSNAIIHVGCYDASGNSADMRFSLIVSKGRHLEGPTFGQFWWTNQEVSTFAMINGTHSARYGAGEIRRNGKVFNRLIASGKSSVQISSCGPKSLTGVPGPQRCKPLGWNSLNGGATIDTICFDRFGNDANGDSCYNAVYATTQTSTVGSAPSTVEVTPAGAGVTASTSDGNVPANTVDNLLTTRWSGVNDGVWIRYDLGTSRLITAANMAVYRGNFRWAHFDVQVSDNGSNWTTVSTFASNTGTTTVEEAYDLPDVRGRYLRYVGHGADLSGGGTTPWSGLTEVAIFAAP